MSTDAQSAVKRKRWFERFLVPVSTLVLVAAITVVFFLYRDQLAEFKELGYLGAFLISLLSTATIVSPMPGLLLLMPLGTALNPFLVGLIGAAGGTVGEITGYILGYSGGGYAQSSRIYARAEEWMMR